MGYSALWSEIRTKLFLAYDSTALALSKVKVTIIFKIFRFVYIPVPVKKCQVRLASHIPPSASNYSAFNTERQWVPHYSELSYGSAAHQHVKYVQDNKRRQCNYTHDSPFSMLRLLLMVCRHLLRCNSCHVPVVICSGRCSCDGCIHQLH